MLLSDFTNDFTNELSLFVSCCHCTVDYSVWFVDVKWYNNTTQWKRLHFFGILKHECLNTILFCLVYNRVFLPGHWLTHSFYKTHCYNFILFRITGFKNNIIWGEALIVFVCFIILVFSGQRNFLQYSEIIGKMRIHEFISDLNFCKASYISKYITGLFISDNDCFHFSDSIDKLNNIIFLYV